MPRIQRKRVQETMNMFIPIKAGFLGFILSIGVQMLVFYVAGTLKEVSPISFARVFVLAGIASFLALDILLYYKVYLSQSIESQMFLVGCIGGWLGGIFFGLTQMKPVLLSLGRRR